jgi:hypothetical protein
MVMFHKWQQTLKNYTFFSKGFKTLFMLSAAGKTSLVDFLTSDIYMLLLAMNDYVIYFCFQDLKLIN